MKNEPPGLGDSFFMLFIYVSGVFYVDYTPAC